MKRIDTEVGEDKEVLRISASDRTIKIRLLAFEHASPSQMAEIRKGDANWDTIWEHWEEYSAIKTAKTEEKFRNVFGLSPDEDIASWIQALDEEESEEEDKPTENLNPSRKNDEEREILEKTVSQAIESLLQQFLKHPYLHRCEHSLHIELAKLLRERLEPEAFVSLVDVDEARKAFFACRVQKEWPAILLDGKKKRGNHDLVILGRDYPETTTSAFLNGRLEPLVVIEFGLDYNLKHLKDDVNKLAMHDRNKTTCFAVHLARRPQKTVIGYLENDTENEGAAVKVYYADPGTKMRGPILKFSVKELVKS